MMQVIFSKIELETPPFLTVIQFYSIIIFIIIKRIFIQDIHFSSIENCYQCESWFYISLKI